MFSNFWWKGQRQPSSTTIITSWCQQTWWESAVCIMQSLVDMPGLFDPLQFFSLFLVKKYSKGFSPRKHPQHIFKGLDQPRSDAKYDWRMVRNTKQRRYCTNESCQSSAFHCEISSDIDVKAGILSGFWQTTSIMSGYGSENKVHVPIFASVWVAIAPNVVSSWPAAKGLGGGKRMKHVQDVQICCQFSDVYRHRREKAI